MPSQVDLTIIGGGPVGLFAAFYAGMRGLSTRIIDSLPELGGQLTALYPEKPIYDMPGFPSVLAKDLVDAMCRQTQQFQPEICLNEVAATLIPTDDGYTLVTSLGVEYPTRTIIVAAGAGAFSPTKIGLEGEESWVGRGLTYGVQNKESLRGKKVAIIGGGDSAFDWAVELHSIAESVCIVHRRDVFRAHEDTIAKAEELGIPKHLFKTVFELHGNPNLETLTLQDTQSKELSQIPCETAVVNIGYKSSLGPIQSWGLSITKNQIETDPLGRTNLPGVFAVGDVASYEGKLKLIATGVGEAATAVCLAKQHLDPTAKLFPGHSSDMDQFLVSKPV